MLALKRGIAAFTLVIGIVTRPILSTFPHHSITSRSSNPLSSAFAFPRSVPAPPRRFTMLRHSTDGYGGAGIYFDPQGTPPLNTLIFMHGLGDTADGWAPEFARVIPEAAQRVSALRHFRLIFPTAPIRPVTLNGGERMPAWFDITSLTEPNDDPKGLNETTARIHNIIAQEAAAGRRIFVGGFSQGGATALYSGLTSKVNVAAVIGISCWIPNTPNLTPDQLGSPKPPVLMCHGEDDNVVLLPFAQQSRDLLRSIYGVDVTFKSYPGLGHSLVMDEMNQIISLLGKHAKVPGA